MTHGADRLDVAILGPLDVRAAGQPVVIRGSTERALLARLALEGSRGVSSERLAGDLWCDRMPQRPKQAIHALVFRLRQALGADAPALATRGNGYALLLAADGLDVWRFEAQVALARRARAAQDLELAADRLKQALAVWRGDALAGLDDSPFVAPRARQLEEARFEALIQRVEVDLDRGLHDRLIGELEALTLEKPTHEGLCRLLMVALYRSGRQVDALAVYERLRKRLANRFGLDPSPPLKELELQILRQDPQLAWQAPAAEPARHRPAAGREAEPGHRLARGALPHPATSFVGRESELAAVLAQAGRHRLVTIAGAGGCGKTRLAIAVGQRLAEDHEVRFVRLEGLTDAGLVAVAVAEALDIHLGLRQPAISELRDALTDRDLVVLLDNCEHVLAACAELILAILESAKNVRFLLTSREQLAIPGEVITRLRPLPTPPAGAPADAIESAQAVRLFTDRAAAATGSARLDVAALATVAEICRQLDGIPLAIELAAVRLATLSVDQLARRLAMSFAVLQEESRAAVPRHRTLLAAIDWSYDLLDGPERSLFARLAVFASAFPLDAAEVICADSEVTPAIVCDLLSRLAAKSLVAVERTGAEVEYRLLNTIREYADSRLVADAERRELAGRHHDWCLSQATAAVRALHDGSQPEWINRLRSRMDDLRAALDWALGPDGRSVTLAAALWQVWEMLGQDREGREWLNRALAANYLVPPHEQADLLLGAAVFARAADDFTESRHLLDRATDLFTDLANAAGIARCQLELGRLLVVEGRLGPALACAAQAREQYRALTDDWGVAWADILAANVLLVLGDYEPAAAKLDAALVAGRRLNNPIIVGDTIVFLGLAALRSGRASEATGYFDETLRLGRLLGSDSLINVALANLGVLAGQAGDYPRATALLDEALALARKRGEPLAVAKILLESAQIAVARGEYARGRASCSDALAVYGRIGALSPVPQCLHVLARAWLSLGDIPQAATLLGAADAARRELGLAAPEPASWAAPRHQRHDWDAAWRKGAELGIAEAIRFALGEGDGTGGAPHRSAART
jgi:predicted ATPase/DNA-binding SARP family transcriptional activator